MRKKPFYTVAVVGATGAVGKKMIETLEKRNFPVGNLIPLSSSRSAGTCIQFKGKEYKVIEATPEAFEGVDFALFSAGGSVSLQLAPEAVKKGAVVIDNTSAYRMHEEVPLVVPEVNSHAISLHKGIIANPNCSTIQMVHALKPIHDSFHIQKIIVSTYQSVSGSGTAAVEELKEQSKSYLAGDTVDKKIMPVKSLPVHHQMAFNVIPQIDVFESNGFTKEEMKMVNETRKILENPNILVTPTCVRVPVFSGHSESVYIETEKPFSLDEVILLLKSFPNVHIIDDMEKQEYPMPLNLQDQHGTFVGRIRKDLFHPNGLNLWIVSDNLLKGAALNAIQIAEEMIK